jgi:hypothetical protein
MELEFSGDVWYWRGPSPFFFVTVPDGLCADLRDAADVVSYGWGMIPVTARIGATEWTTALFPKDGAYAVPLKAAARAREEVGEGDTVNVRLTVDGLD